MTEPGEFAVTASAGSLWRDGDGPTVPHAWTDRGVAIDAPFTGAHLLHLAVAGCVLNDTFREAVRLGIPVDGVRVTAWGDFDRTSWRSTGIAYRLEIDGPTDAETPGRLRDEVARVAEIPRALAQGADVTAVD